MTNRVQMPSPLHILIVDDMVEVGQFLAAVLKPAGHLIGSCRSGAEGLQKLHTSHPPIDLLITDHQMPGSLSGLAMVQLARAKGFDGQIIVTSGHLTPELKESYKAFSVLGFLAKPIDRKLLELAVAATGRIPRPARDPRSMPSPPPGSGTVLRRGAG